jgi:hypothetical protein
MECGDLSPLFYRATDVRNWLNMTKLRKNKAPTGRRTPKLARNMEAVPTTMGVAISWRPFGPQWQLAWWFISLITLGERRSLFSISLSDGEKDRLDLKRRQIRIGLDNQRDDPNNVGTREAVAG